MRNKRYQTKLTIKGLFKSFFFIPKEKASMLKSIVLKKDVVCAGHLSSSPL
tara:strand:- start:10804 stop:10956 length:153 start_codon:yes stop_codon:yes gene_type:complete